MIHWYVVWIPRWRFISSLVGVKKGTYLSIVPPVQQKLSMIEKEIFARIGRAAQHVDKIYNLTLTSQSGLFVKTYHQSRLARTPCFDSHNHWSFHQSWRREAWRPGPPELESSDQNPLHLVVVVSAVSFSQGLTCSCRLVEEQLKYRKHENQFQEHNMITGSLWCWVYFIWEENFDIAVAAEESC